MPDLLQGASKAHEFAATLGRGSREFLVAVRTEGQFVGEMAWFALGAVRCATIRAKGPVRVKIIPGERLDDIVNRVPEVSHHRVEMDSSWGGAMQGKIHDHLVSGSLDEMVTGCSSRQAMIRGTHVSS